MSNIETVNALLTAINFDRFPEIEALHAPDALFTSFRGPTLRSSVDIADWHREFLRDYADCNYSEIEYIEQENVICARATIEAKGYDWRAFSQRVVEVFRFDPDAVYEGEVVERRLYGMLRDLEFDKPVNAAMENALGFRGGSLGQVRQTVEAAYTALLAGDEDAAKEHFHEKPVLIDGVYGLAAGFDNIQAIKTAIPKPAFGVPRVTAIHAGEHDAVVEMSFDGARPRAADWVRLVDGKIIVIESYWMLREIGVRPDVNYARDRHSRQVILPI